MLVIDVEKFVLAPADSEDWFSIDEKPPIANALLEILEGADLKPSDMNGLADPYIKGKVGIFKFKTKVQRKTLCPKWMQEFNIPITSWEIPNELLLEIHDKDPMFDDFLGTCAINLNELRGGERHEKWVQLKNIKMGRLRLAITIIENEVGKGIRDLPDNEETTEKPENASTVPNPAGTNSFPNEKAKAGDEFEPIEIEGQDKTKIWVHRPGLSMSPTFETRKGRVRRADSIIRSRDENAPSVQQSDSLRSDTSTVDVAIDGASEPPAEIDYRENSKVVIDSSGVDEDKEETPRKGKKGFMSMFSRKGSKLKEELIPEKDDTDELIGDPRLVRSSPIQDSSTTDPDNLLGPAKDASS